MSLNPNVMYIENKNKEKWSTGTNLWTVNPVRKSVTLNPGACMQLERKRRETSHDGEDLSAAKPERGRLRGTLGGRTTKQDEKRFKRERPVGWGARAGSMVWYLKGSQQEAVNNVQPKYRNTLRGTYAGDQYDASGRQRGTLILSMGPTRAANGAPKVDNVRS